MKSIDPTTVQRRMMAAGKPNIPFTVADDMGCADCSIHGCK